MESTANALVFHLLVGGDDLLPVLDWLSASSTGGQQDEAFQRVLVGIQEPATRRCYLEVNPRTLQTEILHVAEMAIDSVIASPSVARPSALHAAAEPGTSAATNASPNPSLNSASDFPKLGAKPPSKASRRRLVPTMVAPSVSASSRHDTPELAKAHPQLGMARSTEVQQLSERLQGSMQLNAGGIGREDPFTPPAASMGTWDSRSRATGGIGPSSTSQRLESRLEEVGADRAPTREAPQRTSSDKTGGMEGTTTTSSSSAAAPSGRQSVEALQDSHPAMRLALLHSSLLLLGAVPNLAQELGRLLHLLAAGLRNLHGDAPGGPPTGTQATIIGSRGEDITTALSLHSAGVAWRYAVRVLQGTHRLLLAAPSRALRAIIDESTPLQEQLQVDGPQILQAVQQAVEKEHSQRCFNEKAYDMLGSPGSSLLGPMTHGQHNNQGWRSTEEMQRRTNLEKCRDTFVAIMQDAATASVYAMRSHSIEDAKAGVTDESIPALKFMREQVPKFLLDLRLDNLVGFSEIFLSGYLQAARTGEMIMDDKLASLEQRDPSKFQRLSQRFHTNNPPSAASRTKGRSGGMHGGGRGRSGNTKAGASQRGHTSAGASGEVPSSLHLVQEFPVPLRMYILFIEAADSARLNSHISRQATMKIGELSQSQQDNSDQGRAIAVASSVASLGERAAQLSALGLLLSFVSFTSQINLGLASSGLPGRPQPVPSISSIGPLDIESVLEHISHDGSGTLLAIAMPLVLSYLRFLTQDLLATAAVQRSPVVRLLKQLRQREELQPSHPSFGLPALCIRALLDDWASGVGGMALLESEQIAASSDLPADPISMPSAWTRVNEMLQEIQGSIDARYVSICCPALEDGTRGMISSLAGPAQGIAALPNGSRTTAPRRLTPSQPSPLPTSIGAAPESLRQITSRVPDRTKLKLQKAFLDEYSGPGQKVPLRELVAYISDVTASNSVAKAQSAGQLAQLLRNLENEMLLIVQNTSEDLQGTDAHQSLLRKVQEGSAFQMLIRSTTVEALEGCLAEAREDSSSCIKRALATLLPPDLEHPVLETAAAIAIEYAEAAIAQQLLNAVPRQIQKHAGHACASMCAQIAESLRNQAGRAQSAIEPLQQQALRATDPERVHSTPSEAFRHIQAATANDDISIQSLAQQQQDPSSSIGLVSSEDAHQAAGKLNERKAHALMSRMG